MSEKVSVSGPVKVTSDSKESVALELMREIASYESGKSSRNTDPREYYLELFNECLLVVYGKRPSHKR
jgi:hypothetical protein